MKMPPTTMRRCSETTRASGASFLYTRSSQFANALASNGYATDPSYAVKLNAIIRAHKLDQYDAPRTEP